MKQYLGVALGMVAGSFIGAAAVTGLHAQVKAPSVFLISEIDVTNPEAYGKEFAPKAQATIKAAGGQIGCNRRGRRSRSKTSGWH